MSDNNISDVLYEKRYVLEEHVRRFSENERQYKAPSYDEANTRVDFIDELYKTLEGWREELAKNIALNNKDIALHELNLAVQKIVDRIIFLRIAEDKGIEEYGALLKTCENKRASKESTLKSSIYVALVELFNKANTKYNSGLFATLPFLDALTIDDKVFTSIIEGLYYPNCPYEFSILPAEILGSIYEQFLGKTIKFRGVKGDRHTAIIEEKPEVKKAGGVYYTPQYIVNYIVKRVVGSVIEGKSPDEIENIKIIDPSCGSGSFLVGAYSYLLKHALDYYNDGRHKRKREKALKEGRIYQASENAYKLTIEEKQRILLGSIYGVDIDEQAVEVSKLSLYLKLLEDEGGEAVSKSSLFKHTDFTILPSLMDNIKCGNALVERDYYLINNDALFASLEEKREINVFDWDEEFKSIFDAGGFDCVIGNPPYVSTGNQVASEKLNRQRKYLKKCEKYYSLYKQWDLYIPFIEKGLNILKDGGIYGAIIPYPFTNQSYAESLRRLILQNYNLIEVADLKGAKVFTNATVTNCIPIIEKKAPSDKLFISHINEEKKIKPSFEKPISELVIDERTGVWNLEKEALDGKRHSDLHVLGDFCYIIKGACCNSCEKKAKGEFRKADLISDVMDKKHPRKYIVGKDIGRYFIKRHRFIEYETKRSPTKWQRAKFEEFFMLPRLFTNILGKMIATLDIENHFINDDTTIGLVLWKDLKEIENTGLKNSIKKYSNYSRDKMEKLSENVNLYYLLAILNSRYASYLLKIQRGDYIRTYPEHIRSLPIPIASKEDMDALTSYAKEEMRQHELLKEAKLESDRDVIQKAIMALDDKIDEVVYKIYGVSLK